MNTGSAGHGARWPWLPAGWSISLGSGGEAAVVALLALVMFFAGTSRTPIMNRDEARFAEASREMLADRDLVVPTFADRDRYDKPILIYWATMASYAVAGVDARAARLPSNVAAALAVLLLAWEARRRWGHGAGLLAGLLCSVSIVFWVQAKACTADMVLLLPTLVAMLAFERLLDGSARAWHAAAFWAALAFAVLAKGPIAPAWVLMTALALWAMNRRWRPWEVALAVGLALLGWWRLGPAVLVVPLAAATWRLVGSEEGRRALGRLRWGWGLPLFGALTVPWAVAAQLRTNGEFLRRAVGHHVVERSLSPFESHGGFPLFYLVTGLVVALPLFPVVVEALVRRRDWRVHDRQWRYLVAWLLGPLVLIELVQTKLVHYWLPSYPAAVLLAVWWLLDHRRRVHPAGPVGLWLLAIGGLGTAMVPVVFMEVLEVPGSRPPAVSAGVVMALATVVAVALWRRRPLRAVITFSLGTAAFLTLLALTFVPDLGWRQLGPRTALRAVADRRPEEDLVLYHPRDDDLYFYLPLGVSTCRTPECLDGLCRRGTPFLGVARTSDLQRLDGAQTGCHLVVVDEVEGLDLAHGRWARSAIFRPEPAAPSGVAQ